MHFLSIIGARPQFVKLAPLSRALRGGHRETIVHTGQHYDRNMSALFFEELGIPEPDVHLGVSGGRHGEQTGAMLIGLEATMVDLEPDAVIVFGDTNSTVAGALAAAKLGVPLVHVEAGLRSFNRAMPEEINRVVTDHVSDYLFAPTPVAMDHLAREGLGEKAYLTGDLMVDSVQDRAQAAATSSDALDRFGVVAGDYLLLTLHRPYNVDDPARLGLILEGLGRLGVPIVFPMHPRTGGVLQKAGLRLPPNVVVTEPLGHVDFVRLLASCQKVITDSGGIQKEAYVVGRPCLTVRTETEWVETVDAGWNRLVDPASRDFVEIVTSFQPPSERPDLYGSDVARKMVNLLEEEIPAS